MLIALYTLDELEVVWGAATVLGCTVTVTRLVFVVVTVDDVQVLVDSALCGAATEAEDDPVALVLTGKGLTVTVTR